MENKELEAILNNESLTAREKYKLIYNEDCSRDKARHAIEKLKKTDRKCFIGKILNRDCGESVELNCDGTQCSSKRFLCSEDDIKCPEFLLVKHGYDPNKFVLVSAKSSIWDATTKDGDKVMYSSKITVRPIDYKKDLDALVKSSIEKTDFLKFRDAVKEEQSTINNKTYKYFAAEICFADLHIGLTDKAGNEDFDAQKRYLENVKSYIDENSDKLTEIYITFLGDIFHYDTKAKTTTAGTSQESNTRFEYIYSTAVNYFTELFTAIALHGIPTFVNYVPGNHDEMLGYTLLRLLRELFKDLEFYFNILNEPRKLVKIGSNLVGYTHGDMPAKNITKWIYTDARHMLKDVAAIEIHAGHFHCEKVLEDNGLVLRHLPSLAELSPWEKANGYTHGRRGMLFEWSRYKLESIKYL